MLQTDRGDDVGGARYWLRANVDGRYEAAEADLAVLRVEKIRNEMQLEKTTECSFTAREIRGKSLAFLPEELGALRDLSVELSEKTPAKLLDSTVTVQGYRRVPGKRPTLSIREGSVEEVGDKVLQLSKSCAAARTAFADGFDGDQGVSGGPVVERQTGRVCGVVSEVCHLTGRVKAVRSSVVRELCDAATTPAKVDRLLERGDGSAPSACRVLFVCGGNQGRSVLCHYLSLLHGASSGCTASAGTYAAQCARHADKQAVAILGGLERCGAIASHKPTQLTAALVAELRPQRILAATSAVLAEVRAVLDGVSGVGVPCQRVLEFAREAQPGLSVPSVLGEGDDGLDMRENASLYLPEYREYAMALADALLPALVKAGVVPPTSRVVLPAARDARS